MIELKPYLKVIVKTYAGVAAIYEPHPFRNCVIKKAIEQSGHTMGVSTGIDDFAFCWVFYDWCGNPVGLSDNMPEGEIVDSFTAENLGDQSLADYLNKENEELKKEWYRRKKNDNFRKS